MCTYNIARSCTAEDLFIGSDKYEAKSGGMEMIEGVSGQLVSVDLIKWADVIYMMEFKHFEHLLKNFYEAMKLKETYILGIPDIYKRGDPELKSILKFKLTHLGRLNLP